MRWGAWTCVDMNSISESEPGEAVAKLKTDPPLPSTDY
jgi:hypothetical protein